MTATSQPGWNACGLALLTLIDQARHRLRIATPYARLPQRVHLLDAGVELWLYQPTLLHSKVVTVDGQLSFVGTTDLSDSRRVSAGQWRGRGLGHRPVEGTAGVPVPEAGQTPASSSSTPTRSSSSV